MIGVIGRNWNGDRTVMHTPVTYVMRGHSDRCFVWVRVGLRLRLRLSSTHGDELNNVGHPDRTDYPMAC